jgi:hypothetical protein
MGVVRQRTRGRLGCACNSAKRYARQSQRHTRVLDRVKSQMTGKETPEELDEVAYKAVNPFYRTLSAVTHRLSGPHSRTLSHVYCGTLPAGSECNAPRVRRGASLNSAATPGVRLAL